ncbi:MAG: substrate-binding domain-containing protein [Lachnospirales bacterium]
MKKNLVTVLILAFAITSCNNVASVTEDTQDATQVVEETPVNENTEVETVTSEDVVSEAQIFFNGSSTLGPVIAKLAQDFNEEYVTWDAVNSEFPEEDIAIYVAIGGSSQGTKSVMDNTSDFGMVSRKIKDSEKEAIPNMQEYLVGVDALTVAVNPNGPLASVTDNLTTEEIQKIFSGEYATWSDYDSSLPAEEIVVITRDIGGGAHSVFQDNVMGDMEVKVDAIQEPTMGALVSKIAENEYAIGYASYGVAQQNAGSITMMKLDGVEASVDTILDGSYILQRPLLLVIDGEPNSHQQAFLDVVLGEEGQNVVEEMGFVPAN